MITNLEHKLERLLEEMARKTQEINEVSQNFEKERKQHNDKIESLKKKI